MINIKDMRPGDVFYNRGDFEGNNSTMVMVVAVWNLEGHGTVAVLVMADPPKFSTHRMLTSWRYELAFRAEKQL